MFDVHYEWEAGWRLYYKDKPYSPIAWPSEWDYVEELRNQYPGLARELGERLHQLSLSL